MEEEKLILEMIDLLSRMVDRCLEREGINGDETKCIGCGMERNLCYVKSGCLLIDILENEDFLDVLMDTCRYRNLEHVNAINKILSVIED